MRPKIFINIATKEIGGPGKGLLQFLRYGGTETCDPVVVGFRIKIKNKKKNSKSQFISKIEELGFNFEQIEQKMTYDIFLLVRALKLYNQIKPHVLQSHGYKSHVICFFLKIITGTPWVAFFHGWISVGIKIKIYKFLDKFLFGFADKVVTVSQGMVTGLNQDWIGQDKIHTIYNAVDPEEYSLTTAKRDIRNLYDINKTADLVAVVGRFSHEKGHRYFVEALPQIIRECPELKVMFIGDGPLKEDIRQQVENSGLSRHVIFTGYKSNVQDFYRDIDLLVLPSLSEGMPNVALEAMLFGKTVVATRVGGVPEVVMDGETGIIVDSQNSKQLAEAVIRLLKDRNMLHNFGAAGRERVLREFDPVQRVKKIAAMYEEVLNSNRKHLRARKKNGGSNEA